MKGNHSNYFYVLAALLHDIGKVYQRTGARIEKNYYQKFTKNNGYWHAAFTAQFIDKYLDPKFASIINESAGHHVAIEGIIKMADIYASGHDRRSEKSYEIEETSSNYITDRMYSIFYILFNHSQNQKSYINLSVQSEYFPSPTKEFATLEQIKAVEQSKLLYEKLFTKMIKKVLEIKASTYQELHHYVYPLIKEYTTTIPSSTYNIEIQTVSLFDHLKLTTAISNCLNNHDLDKAKKFMIIEYDLSGIKSFVYRLTGIPTSNLTKVIRARSFYLNILCDFIAYKITREFKVTYENVLYTSGGRGQILVPNFTNGDDILYGLIKIVNSELSNIHHDELYFKFARVKLTTEELQKAKFKDIIYGENREMLNNEHQILDSGSNNSSEIFNVNYYNELCKLCNKNKVYVNKICEFCEKLLYIYDNFLSQHDTKIIEFEYNNVAIENQNVFKFGILGQIVFHNNIETNNFRADSFYLTINEPIVGEVKYYAQSKIKDLTFDVIAQKSYNIKKLAIIKMDVDNLGVMFTQGFSDDTTTISKILTLSRNIDFFFVKIVDKIVNSIKFKGSVFIVYSGGDDLVVVLPPSMVFIFINEVNKKFNQYTNNHPKVHLSSGIEIFPIDTSIWNALLKAEERLKYAKNNNGKNAIGFLDQIILNHQLGEYIDVINYYISALKQENVYRKVIYNIYLKILLSLKNENPIFSFQTYIPELESEIQSYISDVTLKEQLRNEVVFYNISIDVLKSYKIIYSYVLMCTMND